MGHGKAKGRKPGKSWQRPRIDLPEPPRYRAWLSHVFDRPERQWYFEHPEDLDAPDGITFPDATSEELARLCIHTFRHAGTDLTRITDAQVTLGLNFIVSSNFTVVGSIMSRDLPAELGAEVARSIEDLFRDCFELRCTPALSSMLAGAGTPAEAAPPMSPLNNICYMFWDTSPLLTWRTWPGDLQPQDAVYEVLEATLHLSNPACIESALHGLGHLAQARRETSTRAADITRHFMATRPLTAELREYASRAATGYVI